MSRQTDRADARNAAKTNRGNNKVAARAATRKAKGLPPLSTSQSEGYPASITRPMQPRGKSYPFSSKRQNAKYARLAAGLALADAA